MDQHPLRARIAWVDGVKGICIVGVVTFYCFHYIESATGAPNWMEYWVDFAQPFRMPAFFLVAGLFLGRTIDRPWPEFCDGKILHFAYFFALWTTIYFALHLALSDNFDGSRPLWLEYLQWYAEPFHMLWFIAMLPVFFLAVRLLRRAPWAAVLAAAIALQIAHPESGIRQIDRFGERFVYFYVGYLFAAPIFAFAERARRVPLTTAAVLLLWAGGNALATANGWTRLPGAGLAAGLAGAFAVVAVASLTVQTRAFGWLRALGRQSLVVFLAFYLVMVVAAKSVWSLGLAADAGVQTLLTSAIAVTVPLGLAWLARRTPLRALFVRPSWATWRSAARPPTTHGDGSRVATSAKLRPELSRLPSVALATSTNGERSPGESS